MDNMHIIGLVIKEKRKELNLTQKELAERLGVSDKAVSKWERGESLPDVTLIPSIAVTLGISIDYLMTGQNSSVGTAAANDNEAAYSTERDTALRSAAEIAQNKINVLYTIFIFVLLAVLVCFWFVDIMFGTFIQLTNFIYMPVVYIFIVFALYTVFAAIVRTRRTALKVTYNADLKGSLDVVMALVAAGAVFMMIYTYSSPTMRNDDRIIRFILERVSFPVSDRYSIRYSSGRGIAVSAMVYFASAAAATALAKRDKALGKNLVTVTVLCAVMAVCHFVYAAAQQVYIYYKKEFLYNVWLKTTAVEEMLDAIKTANIIYTAVIIAVAVLMTFMLVRDKKQRIAQLIVVVTFAVYLGISAFGFINLDYSGEGAYYAQFINKSITAAFIFVPACPHIVMSLNVLLTERKRKQIYNV